MKPPFSESFSHRANEYANIDELINATKVMTSAVLRAPHLGGMLFGGSVFQCTSSDLNRQRTGVSDCDSYSRHASIDLYCLPIHIATLVACQEDYDIDYPFLVLPVVQAGFLYVPINWRYGKSFELLYFLGRRRSPRCRLGPIASPVLS